MCLVTWQVEVKQTNKQKNKKLITNKHIYVKWPGRLRWGGLVLSWPRLLRTPSHMDELLYIFSIFITFDQNPPPPHPFSYENELFSPFYIHNLLIQTHPPLDPFSYQNELFSPFYTFIILNWNLFSPFQTFQFFHLLRRPLLSLNPGRIKVSHTWKKNKKMWIWCQCLILGQWPCVWYFLVIFTLNLWPSSGCVEYERE